MTMVAAWKRLVVFDPARPFGPWLRGIARNLVLAHHRGRTRNLCTPAVLGQIESRLDQLASRHGDTWDEKLELLHGCVKSLPDQYRTVITLFYLEQRSYKEVADVLGLPMGTLKTHLHRGRAMLRKIITEQNG